jgi:hypothetical protein
MISLFNFSPHCEKSRSLPALTILPCDLRQRNLPGEGVSLKDNGIRRQYTARNRKKGGAIPGRCRDKLKRCDQI